MIVVTGAGHLGGNLVRALVGRGEQVRVLVYQEPRSLRWDQLALEGLPVEIVPGDVCDPSSLRAAFEGADLVFHTAAYISLSMRDWPRVEAINVRGTRNVVEACLASGVRRMVHISSIHALQQAPLDQPLDETRPLVDNVAAPPYDRSKAAAELEVRKGIERGLDALVIYPTGMIGPYDFRPSHFGHVIRLIARGKMRLLVRGGFNWVDVRDVAEAALRAAERAPAGGRYLCAGEWVSLLDVAYAVDEVRGGRRWRAALPYRLAQLAAPPAERGASLLGWRPLFTPASLKELKGNHSISSTRARGELGYQPRSFKSTIADTVGWFAEHDMI